jgi:hypothetical protein
MPAAEERKQTSRFQPHAKQPAMTGQRECNDVDSIYRSLSE